jgi:hypothetical protein
MAKHQPVKGNKRSFAHAPLHLKDLKTTVDHTKFHGLNNRFEDFPPPPGEAPYRMDLSEILDQSEIDQIGQEKKLVFHTAGDTGNFHNDLQLQVAALLSEDRASSGAKFLYHLGDVIYDYGEDREYPDQFYEIYQDYHAPIVAIPGNHDGSEFSGGPDSLVGFMTNFCDSRPNLPPSLQAIGMDFGRQTMTQPNCYWTLTTPLVTIIGLYTNVPSGGVVVEPQAQWFKDEMKAADTGKPLIVAMHHPIHSVAAVASHAGSLKMKTLLEEGCTYSRRLPELVLAGHVHNYQRFTTTVIGKKCVFVVAGCGGHARDPLIQEFTSDTPAPNDPGVTVNFATRKYVGVLRMTVTPGKILGEYIAAGQPSQPVDSFQV